MSRDGSAISAALTVMRDEKPTAWLPDDVIAPVNAPMPSLNSGTSGPPPVSDVVVAVADIDEMSILLVLPSSSARSVVPLGLENCKPLEPSALLICETTDARPLPK